MPRKTKRRSAWPKVLAVALTAAIWGGLVYAGFFYAKAYIDRSIRSVQETNAMQIQAIDEKLTALRTEMEAVEEAIRDTDKTLSSSDSTRKALNDKIEALDEQLKRLEKSLNILKEAPDAGR